MWNYYGSKSKLAKHYPPPRHKLIIEPFAGAAWYSLRYPHKNVLINELDETIFNIWKWLICEATTDAILGHVDFHLGDDVYVLDLPKPHLDMIGFCANRGSTSPKRTITQWSCQSKTDFTWASSVAYRLKEIAKHLPLIRHWKIKQGDYRDIENQEATWFIDPPYQHGGHHYVHSDVDYSYLSKWSRDRKGQVIVCENDQANWLPFSPLRLQQGQKHKTTESVWLNQHSFPLPETQQHKKMTSIS